MEDKFEETEMMICECSSFEIFAFKDEVTTIAEKLMIVGHLGAVSYGFSEPDIA